MQQGIEKRNAGNAMMKCLSVLLAMIAALATVAYATSRVMRNRAYDEKWRDYEECGL